MSEFHLTILGCGSALPARGRNPSAQYLRIAKYRFLIDCGEGTQQRMREQKLKLQGITHIFISHMHGDHYLGLMGMLFSMTLLGRKKELTICGPPEIKELISMHLGHANAGLGFPLKHIATQAGSPQVIIDLPTCSVTSIPLDHKIPTTGFLIKEKPRKRKLRPEKLAYYEVPIKMRKGITEGEDHFLPDGEIISNKELTFDPPRPYSYAYCSDTAYLATLSDQLKGVDVLYHESTFMNEDVERAHSTRHSTAAEAAHIASSAGVGRLLLGHYSARYKNLVPLLEEAQKVFKESYLSEEGMQVDVHSIVH